MTRQSYIREHLIRRSRFNFWKRYIFEVSSAFSTLLYKKWQIMLPAFSILLYRIESVSSSVSRVSCNIKILKTDYHVHTMLRFLHEWL